MTCNDKTMVTISAPTIITTRNQSKRSSLLLVPFSQHKAETNEMQVNRVSATGE